MDVSSSCSDLTLPERLTRLALVLEIWNQEFLGSMSNIVLKIFTIIHRRHRRPTGGRLADAVPLQTQSAAPLVSQPLQNPGNFPSQDSPPLVICILFISQPAVEPLRCHGSYGRRLEPH